MADVPITFGSGQASVAADNVAGSSYQKIKLYDGTLGSTNAAIVNSDGTLNARISGSVLSAGSTFNGSVSGTVGASVIGTVPTTQSGLTITSVSGTVNVSGSVAAFQGTSPWIITGSIQGGSSPNQSVSGTVGASVIGTVPVILTGNSSVIAVTQGSVAATITNFPTSQNVSGSVVATQGTSPWVVNFQNSSVVAYQLAGSILATSATVNPAANQSVSGTVQADIRGSVATVIIGGSIAASFTPPANQSVSGTVQTDVRGSVAVAIISGSIAATFTPPANQSVSGTVNIGTGGPVSVTGTMSVLGTVPVTQSTSPWIITGSVQGSFSPSGNQSVSGTVQVDVRGSVAAVIIGGSIATATTNSSVMLLNGANVIGSVTALQGTNPWIVSSSVAGGLFPISGSVAAVITNTNINVSGSVAAFVVGSSSIITVEKSSSILAVPVGSVQTIWLSPSIVGTYAEDAAHATGDKGVLSLNVRNDTLSSVTSADGDYGALALGPAGEAIVANSPLTKWVQGTADFRAGNAGASIQLIATGGTSVFTYITGVQIANMGSASVLVTLASAGSTLGYSIAPAGGGSNIYYPNALKSPSNGNFAASISGIASVLVSAQGFISKT